MCQSEKSKFNEARTSRTQVGECVDREQWFKGRVAAVRAASFLTLICCRKKKLPRLIRIRVCVPRTPSFIVLQYAVQCAYASAHRKVTNFMPSLGVLRFFGFSRADG